MSDRKIGAYLISRLEEKDLKNDSAMKMVKNIELRWQECERIAEGFAVQGESNAAAYSRGMAEGFRQAIDTICYYA